MEVKPEEYENLRHGSEEFLGSKKIDADYFANIIAKESLKKDAKNK